MSTQLELGRADSHGVFARQATRDDLRDAVRPHRHAVQRVGRFVALLRRYSEEAQFIVITHQKKTMEAADILYGVTMGADGVSEIVSRRLPREAVAA